VHLMCSAPTEASDSSDAASFELPGFFGSGFAAPDRIALPVEDL
jgi:hypothetical protein